MGSDVAQVNLASSAAQWCSYARQIEGQRPFEEGHGRTKSSTQLKSALAPDNGQKSDVAVDRFRAKLRQQRRAGTASLILSHVSFLMLINDCVGRPRPGVQIAKAAITSNYIRNAFFDRTVLAVPVSIFSDAIDCAPGGVAVSSAGRSSEPCCRHNNNQTNYQLRKGFCHGFCHDDASSISRVFFKPTPQRKNKSRTTLFKSKGQGN